MDASSDSDATKVATAPDPLVGAVLGDRYEIVRPLAEGGMGKLYEARHTRLPRRFAVKVIREAHAGDPGMLARFRREAEVASSLKSANIVDVVDFDALPSGPPYLVMELLEGEDLFARMGRLGALSPRAIHAIVQQVVAGLTAAHARGVLHRDIKPENIFLAQTPDGEVVKLLDFGLSKILDSSRPHTRMLLGTPYFMSPEQARGHEVDQRTDVYALGVVLYQLLTGRLPHEGETAFEVLGHLASEEAAPPSRWRSDLAGPLEDAILAATAKDPTKRTPTVEALWAKVGPALLSLADVAAAIPPIALGPTAPSPALPGPRPTRSRPPVPPGIDRRPLYGLGATVLIAAGLTAAWRWGHTASAESTELAPGVSLVPPTPVPSAAPLQPAPAPVAASPAPARSAPPPAAPAARPPTPTPVAHHPVAKPHRPAGAGGSSKSSAGSENVILTDP